MKILPPTRYECRFHVEPIGIVRAGGIDWISDALNDEAVFWAGWRGIEREVRTGRCRSAVPMPAWYLDALRRSASLASASRTTD